MNTWNSESRMLKHLTCLGVCACGSSQQMRHVKLSFDLERQLELSWDYISAFACCVDASFCIVFQLSLKCVFRLQLTLFEF